MTKPPWLRNKEEKKAPTPQQRERAARLDQASVCSICILYHRPDVA